MADIETYLGDGLYASFDGWQFKLRAPREERDDFVFLEPVVLDAFEKYVAAVRAAFFGPLAAVKIRAPWTDEQVAALNRWQGYGFVHEFTCPNDHPGGVLTAKPNGWICPLCDYTQNWAHAFMFEPQTYPPDSL